MSQNHIIEIECPKCHRNGQFTVWDIMDTSTEPGLREKVFDGSAFVYTCPNCGKRLLMPYSSLYIAPSYQTAIFFDFNSPDDYDYHPLKLSHSTLIGLEGYTLRYVMGLNKLREKIQILEAGLDDVAVERMKYMIAHNSSSKFVGKNYDIFFDNADHDDKDGGEYGSITFTLVDDKGETYDGKFPIELYYEQCLAVKLDPRMRVDGCISVDSGWISRQFKSGHEDKKEIRYRRPMKKQGYYEVECGIKHNIQRPDGTLVLREWPQDVYDIDSSGFFIFGNTIARTKTTPTRYMRGIAHINGDVIFPPIFERVYEFDKENGWYGEIGTKPYILSQNGSVIDPEGTHLPQKIEIDDKSFLESLANWVLPGLQFFYRDTDAIDDASLYYQKGQTLRAGFFVDVTTKLLKPLHKARFIIASAHAALLFEMKGLVRENPDVERWNLTTLHFNSYFKVMDVYKTPSCTQVFLLHIPPSAALLLGDTDLNFIDQATGDKQFLSALARQSLDEKLRMDYHPRPFDETLCKRMEAPVGLDADMKPYPLAPAPESGEVAALSRLIHKLAKDEDIEYKTKIKDNFNWKGPKGTVCEGCIYTRGIPENATGCGRLFKKSFRERVIKGQCEFYKTSLGKPSLFEKKRIEETKKELERKSKQNGSFAVTLLKDFIREKLDGDMDKLKDYDLHSLKDDRKYGDSDFARADIVRAIASLVFGDVWPGLNFDAIDNYAYWPSVICDNTRLLGARILYLYYKGLESWGAPKALQDKALKYGKRYYSLGDIIVWPNKYNEKKSLTTYFQSYKFRGYMDQYLTAIYNVMISQQKVDLNLKALFYKNRKVMGQYQGADGFKRLVNALMLDDFVDADGKPLTVFPGVWSYMKGLDQQTYFKAVEQYLDFCDGFISRRADKMMIKLKAILLD